MLHIYKSLCTRHLNSRHRTICDNNIVIAQFASSAFLEIGLSKRTWRIPITREFLSQCAPYNFTLFQTPLNLQDLRPRSMKNSNYARLNGPLVHTRPTKNPITIIQQMTPPILPVSKANLIASISRARSILAIVQHETLDSSQRCV